MKALRILALIAGVAAVGWALSEAWRTMSRYSAIDFYLVYVNGQVAGREDVPNIYTPEVQVSLGEEYYQRAIRSGLPLFIADATVRRTLDSRGSPFLYASMGWLSDTYDTALLMADEPYALLIGATSPDLREPLITASLILLYGASVWMLGRRESSLPERIIQA